MQLAASESKETCVPNKSITIKKDWNGNCRHRLIFMRSLRAVKLIGSSSARCIIIILRFLRITSSVQIKSKIKYLTSYLFDLHKFHMIRCVYEFNVLTNIVIGKLLQPDISI
jgi:hypothetical protein